jgi:hypothetical protein
MPLMTTDKTGGGAAGGGGEGRVIFRQFLHSGTKIAAFTETDDNDNNLAYAYCEGCPNRHRPY